MYDIIYTASALEDLALLRQFEQKQVVDEVDHQLKHEPDVETRNRKRLRPNDVAEWELRIGKFRVFYDVQEAIKIVKIEAIGYKHGNRLFIHGEEYEL